MARPTEFVDPEYDRKLAEYKALKERLRREGDSSSESKKESY